MEKNSPATQDNASTQDNPWRTVIGLEVHAQVACQSKLFSNAKVSFNDAPNSRVSLVDVAMPGTLPVVNSYCIEQAIRTGLGLNAVINKTSVFERKNYFYPDLPQGYQISQFQHPIVGEGILVIDTPDGKTKDVRIERLHLEQDAGKSLHDQEEGESWIDLNRSGIPLMEIVSYPDMESAEQAQAYVRKLRSILRYLGTCHGNMEQGELRVDVNVSVHKQGTSLGTRCELKNINSMRFMGQAIAFEVARHINILEQGGTIQQQTRLFDARTGETRAMRSKEEAHDYRYFPDPDLLPVTVTQKDIEAIKKTLPELPDARKNRFISAYALSPYEASVLTADHETADYFETVATKSSPKLAANWIIGDYFGALNKAGKTLLDNLVPAHHMTELLELIENNTLSTRMAKEVFAMMCEGKDMGKSPATIAKQHNMRQVTDTSAITAAIDAVIKAEPEKAASVKEKPKMLGWFVGQVMKATKGKADPAKVNQLLKEKLLG